MLKFCLFIGVWAQHKENFAAAQSLIAAEDEQGGIYQVPMYHTPMLNDVVRNDAFYKALQKYVTPESVVVDLGAGSGLLSLMAASLGAQKTFAVEKKSFCESMTRGIVIANNFSDKIEVICEDAKFITSNDLGHESGILPTILVSETLDSYIIGEGFLRMLHDWNVRRVIPHNITVIPHHATLYMQLSQTSYLLNDSMTVSGFDFSLLDPHRPMNEVIVGHVLPSTHRNLSEAFPVIDFDFTDKSGDFFHYTYKEIPIIEDGTLGGAVFSFDLSLDEDEEIKLNTYIGSETHWRQLTQIFDWKRAVYKGQDVRLQIGQLPERIVVVDADNSVLVRFNNAGETEVEIYASKINETACSIDDESYAFSFSGGEGEYNLWKAHVGQIYMFEFQSSGRVATMVVPAPRDTELFVYEVRPPSPASPSRSKST